jgi:hypothetical protein
MTEPVHAERARHAVRALDTSRAAYGNAPNEEKTR